VSERVMVVLTPNEPFFSSIMMRTSCIRWDVDEVNFVLDQHA
jgi:hypothetical protein